MKLPLQAPSVIRDALAWPSGHSTPYGGSALGIEPAGCKVCGKGPDPCAGGYKLVECTSSGTCQCCPNGYKPDPQPGGACACKK